MLITAMLVREDGKVYGYKRVPEDCKVLRWGGSNFYPRDPNLKDPGVMTFIRTDTFHIDTELDPK